MRCYKAWMLLIAAVLLLAGSTPVSAWDGRYNVIEDIKTGYGHPWQDENQSSPPPEVSLVIRVNVGAVVITIDVALPAAVSKVFGKPKSQVYGSTYITSGPTTSKPPVVSRRSEVI